MGSDHFIDLKSTETLFQESAILTVYPDRAWCKATVHSLYCTVLYVLGVQGYCPLLVLYCTVRTGCTMPARRYTIVYYQVGTVWVVPSQVVGTAYTSHSEYNTQLYSGPRRSGFEATEVGVTVTTQTD